MSTRYTSQSQKGIALVVVLLVVAVVTILATQMTSRLQLNIARTANIKDNNQAYWYAMSAEQFAQKNIRLLLDTSADNINLSQPWNEAFEFPLESGIIRAKLTDMQSLFNLNGVGVEENPTPDQSLPSLVAFEDLLSNHIEDSLVVETVRDSVKDWIDDDDFPSAYGAEDLDYEALPNPYIAANSSIGNLSELRLINGFGEGVRQGWLIELLPKLTVFPESTYALNVNTVTLENSDILSALTGVSLEDANRIIEGRPEEGFNDINDFLNLPEVSQMGLSADKIKWFDVTTKYFKLNIEIEFVSGARFAMVTVFEMNKQDNSVSIITREFGGL